MFEPKTLRHYQYELSAMLTAAADQDPEGLVELENLLKDALKNGVPQAAAAQRDRQGFSWAQFAKAAGGITRYAAQLRYTAKDNTTTWIRTKKAA